MWVVVALATCSIPYTVGSNNIESKQRNHHILLMAPLPQMWQKKTSRSCTEQCTWAQYKSCMQLAVRGSSFGYTTLPVGAVMLLRLRKQTALGTGSTPMVVAVMEERTFQYKYPKLPRIKVKPWWRKVLFSTSTQSSHGMYIYYSYWGVRFGGLLHHGSDEERGPHFREKFPPREINIHT